MQFNYFLDQGAFTANADGTYSVDVAKMKDAVRSLDNKLLTLEATGDYAGAKEWMEKMGTLRPETKQALTRLKSVPTDIAPIFETVGVK